MPFTFASQPFRGGNSLVTSGAWFMAGLTAGSSNHDICARHAFSLNNCNGCHKRESGTDGTGGSTNFTHITTSPGVPVQLSKFLTGGGPGLVFNVNDPQLGAAVVWQFADLERRFQRLFDIANCTACATVRSGTPGLVNQILQLAKVLPIDPTSDVRSPGPIGPITSLDTVKSIMTLRLQNLGDPADQAADFLRPAQTFSE